MSKKVSESTLQAAEAAVKRFSAKIPGGVIGKPVLRKLFSGVGEKPDAIISKLVSKGVLQDVGYRNKDNISNTKVKLFKVQGG